MTIDVSTLPRWSPETSRQIRKRVVVEGALDLQTPAHFGNGDGNEQTDMLLLRDTDSSRPLLPGTSIAGAMRAYLTSRAGRDGRSVAARLFGEEKGADLGRQSALIVDDALADPALVETRDGVGLDAESRTASDKKLFSMETWEAGTSFPLRFELAISGDDLTEIALTSALATALTGFENGAITLGARKTRGLGRIRVAGWKFKSYDLADTAQLLDWIGQGGESISDAKTISAADLATQLNTSVAADSRRRFEIRSVMALNGSILIRGRGPGTGLRAQPDMAHLHSKQANGQWEPIISGTSLAGALRARATRIANAVAADATKACEFVDRMFGVTNASQAWASRVRIEERPIEIGSGSAALVQNRVAIDRFTGGAFDTALFDEQPVFGGAGTHAQINVSVVDPTDAEIGLLLLLLKDLWTGDLPLGGEISVGRGRLAGVSAVISLPSTDAVAPISLNAAGGNLSPIPDPERATLEGYVKNLRQELAGGVK